MIRNYVIRIYGMMILALLTFQVSTPIFAQCSGTNSGSKACIEAPAGILSTNDKVKGSIATLNWLFSAIALIAFIVFAIKGSKKLNDEDFIGSFGPFAGAVMAGIVLYLAQTIAV